MYRINFKRDNFKDLAKLEKSFKAHDTSFELEDLEIFEKAAYIIAYYADKTIPPSIEDINVNLKMYKSGNLKMYNFTHSIHLSNGRIHP